MRAASLTVLLLVAAPSWALPDPAAPAPKRNLKTLKLDLGKQKLADLEKYAGIESLTLTGPYDGGW